MSKTKTLCMTAILTAMLFLSACSYYSRFSPPARQEVQVILKENDFALTKTNLTGTAEVWYLFGFIPMGDEYLLGFIPMGDERIFSRALADLYRGVQDQVRGRPCQLVNWTYDDVSTNYFFVTRKKVIFRSDLMEFTK